MRESRTYGSGRGACDETHVPTAPAAKSSRCSAAQRLRGRSRRAPSRGQKSRVRRREFITLVSGVVVWPLATHAHPKAVQLVGVLMNGTATDATVSSCPAAGVPGKNECQP